ncbi:MAG: hypothetical protein HY873_01855 [Chloroflexi bacterium]|nr:hypothetical protein [Chloroflexota bacterium]
MPGVTIPCGNGMTDGVREALRAVLHAIIPSMFKSQQPWALMGSTASVLQGIPDYIPPDIDITTTMEGAYIMEGAIGHIGAAIRPVSFSVREPYASYFGVFEVGGVKTEVMGDLTIKYRDGVIDVKDHWSRWSDKVRVLHFDKMHVPVIPLEWQLVANMLLERPERTTGISRFLLEHGFDRPYLDALLADRQLGSRTIAGVREVLRLD